MIPQVRVKLKSLAAEARFIRTEEGKAKKRAHHMTAHQDPANDIEAVRAAYTSLHTHRVCAVRSEARLASLVYAMLRGRDYAKTEAPGSKPVDVDRMIAMYARFGWLSKGTATRQAKAWLGIKEEDTPP